MCGIQHDVLSNRDSYVTNELKFLLKDMQPNLFSFVRMHMLNIFEKKEQ
jgi:hypothetical protein